MGYKDKEKQKEYQRKWMQKRRKELLANKVCEHCQSKKDLTLFNVKSKGKKFSLSYSKDKLNQKINNAKVLCESCFNLHNKEIKKERATRHGHAGKRSSTYITWRSMIERCYYIHKDNYKYYGERGVEVCDRWHEFENFLADMGERPESMTLDRINPFGNYEINNCRWATALEQGRNKRRNVA